MANREFVMLAQTLKKRKLKGFWYSEKLDGMRCLWDGGISRGVLKSEIPWANNDRDERLIVPPVATGLWSRYGNVIQAPNWFLDQLPPFPLDGELYLGRGQWQRLSTIVKRLDPGPDWSDVNYHVFDMPTWQLMFQTGTINNTNFSKRINNEECMALVRKAGHTRSIFKDFREATQFLHQQPWGPNVKPVKQTVLESVDDIPLLLREINDLGGEGLIFRDPSSYWEPKRSACQVKIKEQNDAEGTVVGYTWGRETDKGSKLIGLMGSLLLSYRGNILGLSGFTDDEREMHCTNSNFSQEGFDYPGEKVSNYWTNPLFPLGTIITFRYRELSDSGIPKEARFLRKRDIING